MLDVVNYYEQLVLDQLWQIAENEPETLSRTFLEDVACLALNSLPPCYVRHMADKSASLSEQDYQAMQATVKHAVEQAIAQVRRYPHEARE
ncbi:MAG: late competence development ComFB family protein [Gammaproteobacteria bacterium]